MYATLMLNSQFISYNNLTFRSEGQGYRRDMDSIESIVP